jgi:hypothetical protein
MLTYLHFERSLISSCAWCDTRSFVTLPDNASHEPAATCMTKLHIQRCHYPVFLLHIGLHSDAQVQSTEHRARTCSLALTAHMVDCAGLCVGQRALVQARAARLPQRVAARQRSRLNLVAGAGGVLLRGAILWWLPGHMNCRTRRPARRRDGRFVLCSGVVTRSRRRHTPVCADTLPNLPASGLPGRLATQRAGMTTWLLWRRPMLSLLRPLQRPRQSRRLAAAEVAWLS